MPETKHPILYGWKDICEYLGKCTPRTAQKRAKRVGIIFEPGFPALDTALYEERVRMKNLGLIDKQGNIIKKRGGNK
jgi:hypothetical protein